VSRRPLWGWILEALETLAVTLIIFVGLQTFVAQPYRVQQESMEATLEPGQYVLVDKLTPRFDGYRRGDIVVFTPPADFPDAAGAPFIKRIVAVGGDRVEVKDGRLWVNGQPLDEPYVYEGQPTEATGGESRWVVPPGDYFVLGDHRQASADSRVFGPIPASSIIGRAWLRYWPPPVFGILPTPTYPALAGG
jgi:signal peptidase I